MNDSPKFKTNNTIQRQYTAPIAEIKNKPVR